MSHTDHDHNEENQAEQTPQVSQRDKNYWLSLEQWGGDEEFNVAAQTEFMNSPLREGADEEGGWARREFLKLMGASLAMVSTACIRRPVQKIVPYNTQPEEVTFDRATYYSSSFFDGNETLGLLVKTNQGRPIKVEGNPNHPLTKGASSSRAQAHILSLYDPERLKGPIRNLLNKEKSNRDTVSVKWDDADDAIVKQLKKGGVVVLTGNISSPTTRALVSDFTQGFKAKHVVWEPLSNEEVREGQKASYGEEVVPFYRFDKAKVIVSIDADFLGGWLSPVAFTKQFSAGRKDPNTMSQLVVFDSNYSLTGANADYRFKIKPSQQIDAVMALAHEVIIKKAFGRYAGDSKVKNTLGQFADAASKLGIDQAKLAQIAENLIKAKGQSLIVAGGLPTQTAEAKNLQVAVNFLNSALDNDGNTVDYKNAFVSQKASSADLNDLIEDLNKGLVKTVIIHKTNPVYSLPADSGFLAALKKAELVISTADRVDETAKFANYVLPDNHQMESWGDAEAVRGVVSIQQPTIRPMYDSRSFQLTLMTWAYLGKTGPARLTTPETFYDYLRAYWRSEMAPKYAKGKSFEDFWDMLLQEGVVYDDSFGKSSSGGRTFRSDALGNIKPSKNEGYELVLYPSVKIGDGSLANVAWLQELPDVVSKVVWDNYVSVSIATAAKFHLKEGDILELTVNGKKLKIPAHIQPGLHDDVMAIAIGYGRSAAGKVGNNIGVNVAEFINFNKGQVVYSGSKVEATKTSLKTTLANVQSHHTMEGRAIALEATQQQFKENNSSPIHKHPVFSIWSGHQYNGHKWGMAVDLNTCTGCHACVTACQSENNIPVVGKKYVIQGREMHWMRIDRYYVGDPANAETVYQPVMCQQCDNAPCESVCPVLATSHSDEGLNDMVYNRCVGTRYCANNCPYKVRRFNWFNYAKLIEKPMHMALNPDISVRTRGVMEKCTFCVHRIKEGKNIAKLEGRALKDGDIKTACQTACPADAIVFGDVNDANSKVGKIFKEEKRAYALLEEFNAQPAVRYMTKIRNNDQASRGGSNHGAGHGEGGHT